MKETKTRAEAFGMVGNGATKTAKTHRDKKTEKQIKRTCGRGGIQHGRGGIQHGQEQYMKKTANTDIRVLLSGGTTVAPAHEESAPPSDFIAGQRQRHGVTCETIAWKSVLVGG